MSGVVVGCRERLTLLEMATGEQAEYLKGLERFNAAFYEAQDLLQCSQAALKSGDLALARQLMSQCRPEPVRIKFGPTQHDPLAQAPGCYTFHFDADRNVWEVWGKTECGPGTFTNPDAPEELARTGIEIDKPLSVKLGPIMALDSRKGTSPAVLPAGKYRLRLLLSGKCEVKVANETHLADTAEWLCPVMLDQAGKLDLMITPVAGSVQIYGAVVE